MIYAGALLCAMAAMTACSSADEKLDEMQSSGFTLKGGFGLGNRTTIADDYSVLWETSDKIYVWGDNVNSTMWLTKGEGEQTGTFFGYLGGAGSEEDVKHAFYPANGFDASAMTYELPATRTAGESFSPMYAVVNHLENGVHSADFQHLCGMLLVELQNIAGHTTFKLIADGIAGAADLTIGTDGVTLGAGTAGEVAVTFEGKDATLYIPIPAGDYSNNTFSYRLEGENLDAVEVNNAVIQGSKNGVIVAGEMYKLAIKGMTINGDIVTGEDAAVDLGVSVLWAPTAYGVTEDNPYGTYLTVAEAENIVKGYRLPTAAEYNELISSCNWEKTQKDGVEGYLFTSKTNDNAIFFPLIINSYSISNLIGHLYYPSSTFENIGWFMAMNTMDGHEYGPRVGSYLNIANTKLPVYLVVDKN